MTDAGSWHLHAGLVRTISARSRGLRILSLLAASAVFAACSSDGATHPPPPPNIALLKRFDSLHTVAEGDSDQRADVFGIVAKVLAEGAPVQMATISIDGRTVTDSAVAYLEVDLADNGQPNDSSLSIAMWDGHGPDSLILVSTISTFNDASIDVYQPTQINADFPIVSTAPDTLTLTMSAPGKSCTSFLSDEPPGLNAPVPLVCETQTFSISLKTHPQFRAPDSVIMPRQNIDDVRLELHLQR
jgi:hypothetical protein